MFKKYLILLLILNYSIFYGQLKTEEISLKNGVIFLDGTLTFQKEKTPLLIYISGSGNIDRNGNQQPMVKANYIKQFRDKIASNVAFFSYDKRTTNPKNKSHLGGTIFDDFVSDLKVIINHFKNDKRFTEIILLGHSQGALVAMLACDENISKYISLAGAGQSIDRILEKQLSKNPLVGVIAKQHLTELKETGTIKKVNPMLYSVFHPKNHKFLVNWMRYNPQKEIAKLDIPTLIIQGEKDLQVSKNDAKLLHKSNPKTKLFLIKNMNHVLKTINKDEDNINSYYSEEYPISNELIEIVKRFVTEK